MMNVGRGGARRESLRAPAYSDCPIGVLTHGDLLRRYESVKTLMPADRVVGPDAAIFGGETFDFPAIPEGLPKILEARCPFAVKFNSQGLTVAHTHYLIFVPRTIAGIPTSVASLRERFRQCFGPQQEWESLKGAPCMNEPLAQSKWLFVSERLIDCGMPYAESLRQRAYRPARLLEAAAAMVFVAAASGRQLIREGTVRCAEQLEPRPREFSRAAIGPGVHNILFVSGVADEAKGDLLGTMAIRSF